MSSKGFKNTVNERASSLIFRENFRLTDASASETPAWALSKKTAQAELARGAAVLSGLQEKLFAASRFGDRSRVLLVLQGMDTSGKGGILQHVVGAVNPQGVSVTAFKAPSDEEKKHDFLWRIRKALPGPGMIGVFDRSHYEDVLIARVHHFVDDETIEKRYIQIRDFEQKLSDDGVTLVKVMLHLSADEQKNRLADRLSDPKKHWKFNPHDIDEREKWADYREAYRLMLDHTSTEFAPWHIVSADKKWSARLAVQTLMISALLSIDSKWPDADFDVVEQEARLSRS